MTKTKYPSIPSVSGKVPSELQPLLKNMRLAIQQLTGQVGNDKVVTQSDLLEQTQKIQQSFFSDISFAEATFFETWEGQTTKNWFGYTGDGVTSFNSGGNVGGQVLHVAGYKWLVSKTLIPYNSSWLYKVSGRFRRKVAATDPTKEGVFLGITGVGDDRVTLVNVNGADAFGSQHFTAAEDYDMTAHAIDEWVSFEGWFQGYGTHTTTNDRSSPSPLTANIAYLRPTFIVNYEDGDGEMEIDYISIEAHSPGFDGIPGADGTDGADAVGTEYVFAKYTDSTLPSSKRPLNSWGYDSAGTVDGLAWSDGAPDLDATDIYLYRSQRQIIGFPAVGSAVTASWTVPVIVGRYGLDGIPGATGNDGVDADGIEYIFAKHDSATMPGSSNPDNAWGYDNPGVSGGVNWTDGAPDLDATDQYLFMSQRQIQGAPAFDDPVTANWTTPTVVARYGVDGANGVPGADGSDGEDGTGTEYIFTKHDSDTLPGASYPSNSWGYDNPGTVNGQVWTDGAPNLDATDPYLFQSQRKVQGVPAFNDAVSDNWTTPVVVGRFGADGATGVNAPVKLVGGTFLGTSTSPTDCTTNYALNTASDFANEKWYVNGDAGTILGSWLITGQPADYDVRVTVTAGSLGSGTTGTWLNLATARVWSVTDTTTIGGAVTATILVEIRNTITQEILVSKSVTLSAEKQV